MAKTKTKALVRYKTPHHTARPIVIRQVAAPKKHHGGKRGHRKGGGGGLMNKTRMGIVAGAFIVGFLEKQGIMSSLPSLPLIGRTGTIGLGAYLVSDNGRNKLADEICTAALVLAAHELSSTGTIVGGDVSGQVDYVAGW